MKVKLKDFPHQPGALPCCGECNSKAKKDCQPDPMKCIDFYIQNKAFIDQKLAEVSTSPKVDKETYYFMEWLILEKDITEERFKQLTPIELKDLQAEYTSFKNTLRRLR